MITSLNLLQDAIGLLTRNPLKTLTVLAPALVLMALVGIAAAVAAPEFLTAGAARTGIQAARSDGVSLCILAAFVLSYAIMAILWHRHTLRDTGDLAPLGWKLLISYIWRALALTAIQIVINLALIVPLIIHLNNSDASTPAPALTSILLSTFVMQLVLLWLTLRLSLILPAAALGRPISMKLSWRYTDALSRPLWGVAAALAAANTLATGFVTLIDLSNPGQRLMIEMLIYITQGLLIVSVLTTLYAFQARKTA